MSRRYPFLFSIPHGGTEVPPEVRGLVNLSHREIVFNSDPHTRLLYGIDGAAEALIDFDVSRIFVDTNRAPYDYPPQARDGVVKAITQDGASVYQKGQVPDRELIGILLQKYYFPFHKRLTEALDTLPIEVAFDCHSMLPEAPPIQSDAGRPRPLFCLSNRGNRHGKPRKKGDRVTCPPEWLLALTRAFQDEFDGEGEIAMNEPFRGGFISMIHHQRTRIPWIQIEINRALYETEDYLDQGTGQTDEARIIELRERIFSAITAFWDEVSG